MRAPLSLLCLLFLAVLLTPHRTAEADQTTIPWMTFEEAAELLDAGGNGRAFFVDVYLSTDSWGRRMDQTTFQDPRVVQLVSTHFNAVKFDAETTRPIVFKGITFELLPSTGRTAYHALAASLLDGRMAFPTTVFLDSSFSVIQRIPGFHEADVFQHILSYFGTGAYQTQTWEDFQAAQQ